VATKSDKPHCPQAGDFVWLAFDPTQGHEQAGRRPALILSPYSYNQRAGLCLACPITNTNRGYPFDVQLPSDFPVSGVVRADQVRSLAWAERYSTFITAAPVEVLQEVRDKLAALLEL